MASNAKQFFIPLKKKIVKDLALHFQFLRKLKFKILKVSNYKKYISSCCDLNENIHI